MNRRKAWSGSVLFVALFLSGQLALAASKFEEAVKLYNNKQYREASVLLEDHLKAAPGDVNAAYWAAICYQQLGNMMGAKKYYRVVATQSPNSQIGGYARDILRKVDPSFAAPASTASASGSAASSTADSAPAEDAINPNLPRECDVRCQKEHGDIFVEPTINGRTLKMVLDTGAPGICAGREQLEEIGLTPPKGKPDGQTGGSSNATEVNFWNMKARVKLGAIEKETTIRVLEKNEAHPLLGQTFFRDFEYTIDQGAGMIHFRQRGLNTGGAVRNAISIPFEFRKKAGNRIVVNLEINGKAHPVMFDTGNSAYALSFESKKQAEAFGAHIPEDAQTSSTRGISGSGAVKVFTVAHLRLGAIDAYNVVCDANDSIEGEGSEEGLPLLGEPFWKDYQYTVDMKNKILHFVRR